MFQTFAVIQGVVSILLIIVVLLQEGKKGMGSVFGGSSGSVFGARGAGNLLTKVTSVLAFLFMLNSVWLAHLSSDRGSVVQAAGDVGLQATHEEEQEAPKAEKNRAQEESPAQKAPQSAPASKTEKTSETDKPAAAQSAQKGSQKTKNTSAQPKTAKTGTEQKPDKSEKK